jgi:hypothetical protein
MTLALVKHYEVVMVTLLSLLAELAECNYIHGSNRAKSVYITEKGTNCAKELMKKYNIK